MLLPMMRLCVVVALLVPCCSMEACVDGMMDWLLCSAPREDLAHPAILIREVATEVLKVYSILFYSNIIAWCISRS